MQIYNLKARYKQVAVWNTKIDLMELVSLCQAIRNTPTDYDVLFVIGIDHKVSHGKLKNENKERKITYFREWKHWEINKKQKKIKFLKIIKINNTKLKKNNLIFYHLTQRFNI